MSDGVWPWLMPYPTFINPQFRSVLRRDRCAYCGGPGGTIDHIVPKASGGGGAIENLTGACPRCNRHKGHASLLVFIQTETTMNMANRGETA